MVCLAFPVIKLCEKETHEIEGLQKLNNYMQRFQKLIYLHLFRLFFNENLSSMIGTNKIGDFQPSACFICSRKAVNFISENVCASQDVRLCDFEMYFLALSYTAKGMARE